MQKKCVHENQFNICNKKQTRETNLTYATRSKHCQSDDNVEMVEVVL